MTHPSLPPAPNGASTRQPAISVSAQAAGQGSASASVLGTWGARVVLIIVAACALVSVAFILFGAGDDTISRVVLTDVALIVFAFLVWLDTVIGRYRPEWFEVASLATDAYLLFLWVFTAWAGTGAPFDLAVDWGNAILCLLFLRGMLALVDLTRWLWSRGDDQITRVLASIAGAAFGVLAVMVTLPTPHPFNGFWDHDIYGRIVASAAVIAGVALVLVPLWGLLTHRRGTPAAPADPAASAHPPLAWPRLRDGRVVPGGGDGNPDFAAVAGLPLAWPTHVDGSPVPAGADGSPQYR